MLQFVPVILVLGGQEDPWALLTCQFYGIGKVQGETLSQKMRWTAIKEDTHLWPHVQHVHRHVCTHAPKPKQDTRWDLETGLSW